ncbi:hypothetical protein AGDE_16774 [Angomonas deanei]|uniref:Uncharacterized protein n=1 Tax=Angomonas deanei TaxID=59799 RepID=A0A7G2C447_9TRYP|nr:hypothetical protein AGDE_16774 [Angomonas deanei]CAD2213951.1 hypothetical protein, conserved [Angomonas deanei]|eukprot:EPY16233.1 hypothetical protein AGDE_16774 [Angomonas deanei]
MKEGFSKLDGYFKKNDGKLDDKDKEDAKEALQNVFKKKEDANGEKPKDAKESALNALDSFFDKKKDQGQATEEDKKKAREAVENFFEKKKQETGEDATKEAENGKQATLDALQGFFDKKKAENTDGETNEKAKKGFDALNDLFQGDKKSDNNTRTTAASNGATPLREGSKQPQRLPSNWKEAGAMFGRRANANRRDS